MAALPALGSGRHHTQPSSGSSVSVTPSALQRPPGAGRSHGRLTTWVVGQGSRLWRQELENEVYSHEFPSRQEAAVPEQENLILLVDANLGSAVTPQKVTFSLRGAGNNSFCGGFVRQMLPWTSLCRTDMLPEIRARVRFLKESLQNAIRDSHQPIFE